MDLRGYLGLRGSRSVLGRWKDTEYLTFRFVVACAPTKAAFFAVLALASLEVGLVDLTAAVLPFVDFVEAMLQILR